MDISNDLQFYQIQNSKNQTEMSLFNDQIDWFRSKDTINLKYIKEFLTAIDNGTQLPILTNTIGAIKRKPSPGIGVNIELVHS